MEIKKLLYLDTLLSSFIGAFAYSTIVKIEASAGNELNIFMTIASIIVIGQFLMNKIKNEKLILISPILSILSLDIMTVIFLIFKIDLIIILNITIIMKISMLFFTHWNSFILEKIKNEININKFHNNRVSYSAMGTCLGYLSKYVANINIDNTLIIIMLIDVLSVYLIIKINKCINNKRHI